MHYRQYKCSFVKQKIVVATFFMFCLIPQVYSQKKGESEDSPRQVVEKYWLLCQKGELAKIKQYIDHCSPDPLRRRSYDLEKVTPKVIYKDLSLTKTPGETGLCKVESEVISQNSAKEEVAVIKTLACLVPTGKPAFRSAFTLKKCAGRWKILFIDLMHDGVKDLEEKQTGNNKKIS